ncbi:MAG: 30S ribosomal protein S13 [Candidatus Aenigmarchaeota archaeon]|nr:30S ribosomal protein S13 [Candidatus Aenigmarchaeota archaeon]
MGVTKVKVPEEKEKEKKVVKPIKIERPKVEIKTIVRVAGTDLDGEKPLIRALKRIKGIGHTMSKAICIASGFDPKTKLGSLSESEIKKIEEVIKDPVKFGVPTYLVNRRRDIETGKDMHVTGPDLEITKKFDVQRMIDLKTYKGVRHMLGLPVRGQRTRSSFRKGRVVGVVRKAVRIAMTKKEEKKK